MHGLRDIRVSIHMGEDKVDHNVAYMTAACTFLSAVNKDN